MPQVGVPKADGKIDQKQRQGEDLDPTLEAKTKEILKAQARSLAERRGAQAVALAEAAIDSARTARRTRRAAQTGH